MGNSLCSALCQLPSSLQMIFPLVLSSYPSWQTTLASSPDLYLTLSPVSRRPLPTVGLLHTTALHTGRLTGVSEYQLP